MRLQGKVAVITGGASGIGAAAARRFVEEGARVAVCDIQEDKGRKLVAELGEAAIWQPLDVTSEDQWAAAITAAQARFGALTTIVNSAGVSIPASIEAETLEGFRRTIGINLEGVFLGCKHGVAALKGGRGGSIVNVASTLGAKAGAIFRAYAASKGVGCGC